MIEWELELPMVLGAVWKLNTPGVDEHLVQWHRECREHRICSGPAWVWMCEVLTLSQSYMNTALGEGNTRQQRLPRASWSISMSSKNWLSVGNLSWFLSAWVQLLAYLGCLSTLATVQRSPVHHWHELMKPHACGDCISITLCVMIICKICFWKCPYFPFY